MRPIWSIHTPEWTEQSGISEDDKYVTTTESESDSEDLDEDMSFTYHITKGHVFLVIATVISMILNFQHDLHNYWCLPSTKSGIFGSQFVQSMWRQAGYNRDEVITFFHRLRANQQFLEFSINDRLTKTWKPTRKIVVDETLWLFEGRFRNKQHIPNKPHATGLKVFMTVDEKHFIYRYWIYRGHQPPISTLVLDMISTLPVTGHIVGADNYYGSLELGERIQQLGHHFIFNVRSDRPSALWGFIIDEAKRPAKTMGQQSRLDHVRHCQKGTSTYCTIFDRLC